MAPRRTPAAADPDIEEAQLLEEESLEWGDLPDTPDLQFSVWRIRTPDELRENNRAKLESWVCRIPAPFDMERLREAVGGGCFMVRPMVGGRYLGGKRIDIEGARRNFGLPAAVPSGGSEIEERMKLLEARIGAGPAPAHEFAKGFEMAVQLLTKMAPQITPPAASQDIVGALKLGMELAQGRDTEPPSKMEQLLEAGLPLLLGALSRGPNQAPAAVPSAPSRGPITLTPPVRQAQPDPIPSVVQPNSRLDAVRPNPLFPVLLSTLAQAMDQGAAPTYVAKMIFEQCSEQELDLIESLQGSDLAQALIEMQPQLAPRAEHYCNQVLAEINVLDPDDEEEGA